MFLNVKGYFISRVAPATLRSHWTTWSSVVQHCGFPATMKLPQIVIWRRSNRGCSLILPTSCVSTCCCRHAVWISETSSDSLLCDWDQLYRRRFKHRPLIRALRLNRRSSTWEQREANPHGQKACCGHTKPQQRVCSRVLASRFVSPEAFCYFSQRRVLETKNPLPVLLR